MKTRGGLAGAESERLPCLAGVLEKATALFEGNAAAARRWLQAPNHALGNVTPLAFAQTKIGVRAVEDLIGRLEYGVPP